MSFRLIDPREGKRQLAPLDTKQKECARIAKVKESPNGRH
jgi:hypothetical protein